MLVFGRVMSLHKRYLPLAFGVLTLAGVLGAGVSNNAGGFSPFVPEPLPQRALGDLDGDGRSDTAVIQEGAGGSHISVRLSGSSGIVQFDGVVAAVIEGDIDHDGDLDLVAATTSGDVLIWINDGRGRFTRQTASEAPGLFGELIIINTLLNDPAALVTGPLVVPCRRAETAVLVAQIRPPTTPRAFELRFLIRLTLRAPPTSFV
jgi:FG-GAP-like repeat